MVCLIGAKARSKILDSDSPSGVAAELAAELLTEHKLNPSAIDFVISCTATPDVNNPGLVSFLLHRLGIKGIPGLEIKLLSAGPIYALDLAAKMIDLGRASVVLVTGVDFLSRYFNASNAQTTDAIAAQKYCGSGAAVCLLTKKHKSGWQISRSRVGTFAGGTTGFRCNLPASSRVPHRICKEDLEHGLQLPELSIDGIKQNIGRFAGKFTPPQDLIKQLDLLLIHQNYPGMAEDLLTAWGVPNLKYADVFDQQGYAGAAGVIAALAQLQPPGLPRKVLLSAAESGVNYGYTLWESVL